MKPTTQRTVDCCVTCSTSLGIRASPARGVLPACFEHEQIRPPGLCPLRSAAVVGRKPLATSARQRCVRCYADRTCQRTPNFAGTMPYEQSIGDTWAHGAVDRVLVSDHVSDNSPESRQTFEDRGTRPLTRAGAVRPAGRTLAASARGPWCWLAPQDASTPRGPVRRQCGRGCGRLR
jgi:hypothetical protein